MLGVIIVFIAIIYALITRDWAGFSKLAVFGASFFGLSTATDAVIDVIAKTATAKTGQ
jgi:hypothetical protein